MRTGDFELKLFSRLPTLSFKLVRQATAAAAAEGCQTTRRTNNEIKINKKLPAIGIFFAQTITK